MTSIDDIVPLLANSRSYWHGWGAGGDPDADFVLHRSGIPHPLLNGVMRVRNSDIVARIEEARAQLDGLPRLWWVGPDSDPETADVLLAAGATESLNFPIMAVSLDALPERPAPPGLRITRAAGTADVGTFVSTYAGPLWVPEDSVQDMTKAELGRTDHHDSQIRFVGWLDGKPVGTSMLSVRNGVAGIYTVTSHAEYRRRGIGAAMSLAALQAGRALGLHVGTLSATDDGTPVYLALGFKTVGNYRLLTF